MARFALVPVMVMVAAAPAAAADDEPELWLNPSVSVDVGPTGSHMHLLPV